MNIYIHKYAGENTPAHKVVLGDVMLFFSYQTLIAVNIEGKLYVRENDWGTTTGRHLNEIDGGTKEAKAKRLPEEAFETVVETQIKAKSLRDLFK